MPFVKLRLEGDPEAVEAAASCLRWAWPVVEESRDYPGRAGQGQVRRYVLVEWLGGLPELLGWFGVKDDGAEEGEG